MSTRRQFIRIVPLAGAALSGAGLAQAQANLLTEKDAAAVTLGYVSDAAKADKSDKAKYKNWAAGQACANCALFQGKAGDAAAACPLFAGKVVSSKGWCSAYAKKAT